ncbi:helix-hairpin-helix domain-containing protein [Arthrobacter sp. SPG23]|uniref:helix-hairpin-helix domain-containing protein n=1 Tax=Arthrobacter sp. SPG23 TaxID=1610703 RepID=UPI000A9CB347|nr:helix-hairpin-helix domain-containing protein [Arthrobacter sp. SPG23]
MNYANTESRVLLANRKWRIRHSAWLLAPILGFGVFSFVGFLYVALRVRNRKFWIACIVACLGATVMVIANSIWNTRNGSSSAGGAVTMIVYVGLVVFAIVLNRDYLRWRANRTEANAWYNQSEASGVQGPMAPAPGPGGWPPVQQAQSLQSAQPMPSGPGGRFLGVNNTPYYGPPTGQQSGSVEPTPSFPSVNNSPHYGPPNGQPAMRPAPQASTGQDATRATPLDVNSASNSDLSTMLGIDPALADRVVATRLQRGEYRDLDHLIAAVGLQPHELQKFRNKVTFKQGQQRVKNGPIAPSDGLPLGVRPLDY